MAGTLIVDLIGIPKAFYFQSADPAIANPSHMRTGINWIDSTSGPYVWKRRNTANDGWDTLGKIRTDAEFSADAGTSVIAKTPTILTDAATVATDASLNNNFRVTLGGNQTLGNPTNALDGQVLSWEIIQDGTGSRTLALDTKFALGTDITAVTLTTTASKRDFLTAIYNSVADKFYVRGFVKGY
jgi:hypothetical protein